MFHVGQDQATTIGLGAGTGAPRRASTFGPLLSKAQAVDEAKLRDKITNGSASMPAYRLALTPDEIEQVTASPKTVDQRMTKLAIPRAGERERPMQMRTPFTAVVATGIASVLLAPSLSAPGSTRAPAHRTRHVPFRHPA